VKLKEPKNLNFGLFQISGFIKKLKTYIHTYETVDNWKTTEKSKHSWLNTSTNVYKPDRLTDALNGKPNCGLTTSFAESEI